MMILNAIIIALGVALVVSAIATVIAQRMRP